MLKSRGAVFTGKQRKGNSVFAMLSNSCSTFIFLPETQKKKWGGIRQTPCETSRRARRPGSPSEMKPSPPVPLCASDSAVPSREPSESPEAPSRRDIPGGPHLCGSVLVPRRRVRSISRSCRVSLRPHSSHVGRRCSSAVEPQKEDVSRGLPLGEKISN